MTQEFSFKYYISNYNNLEVFLFKEYFKNKIYALPNITVSSKKLINILCINNERERQIFRNAFLKYFKEKIINNLY